MFARLAARPGLAMSRLAPLRLAARPGPALSKGPVALHNAQMALQEQFYTKLQLRELSESGLMAFKSSVMSSDPACSVDGGAVHDVVLFGVGATLHVREIGDVPRYVGSGCGGRSRRARRRHDTAGP